MKVPIDYNSYNSKDFLEDKLFIEWVKYKKPELEQFWESWINTRPANINLMREAEKQLNIILSAKRIVAENNDKEILWKKIVRSIDHGQAKVAPIKSGLKRWVIAASVAAVLIISGAVWWTTYQKESSTSFYTGYGQLKKIILPDQSEITLNAHSNISFRKDWSNGKPREIWLEGEAYFNIKHLNKAGNPIKENERFWIHTQLVHIEVLGTVFNVKERRGKVAVSLETGSVKVELKKNMKQWLLKPGQVAVYTDGSGTISTVAGNPLVHKAWTESKMLTDNTTLSEIIQAIEDQYGVKVILQDPKLADRRIDGTIPLKSESNVLFILSNILNIDIEKKDNTLIFKTRK